MAAQEEHSGVTGGSVTGGDMKDLRMTRMAHNTYRAYGMNIRSNRACPELTPTAAGAEEPDVTIRWTNGAANRLDPLDGGRFMVQPGRFRLDVAGVARYSVEDGRRIEIDPLPESQAEKIRLFLMGSAIGALLYQRGLFPLHGSAVETRWGAMIFVGFQGAGKSTLAGEFYRRGYRLLSDDVCAIDKSPLGPRVLPALPQLRLCADAYERMGKPAGARFDVDKFVVPLGERYCSEPRRLTAVHVLTEHAEEAPRMERIRGLERVRSLLENLYRLQYLRGQRTYRDLMRMAAMIAEKSTVARVSRKKDTRSAGDLVNFLEASWAEEFPELSGEEHCDA
jgi:hypothetical protein